MSKLRSKRTAVRRRRRRARWRDLVNQWLIGGSSSMCLHRVSNPSTRSKVMQAEGSLKTSLVCMLVFLTKPSRMNPNHLCLIIATMERVEVLQAMGSTPALLNLCELLGPLTGKQFGLVGGGGFQGPSCTWLLVGMWPLRELVSWQGLLKTPGHSCFHH